jgi:hypothetical protein
LISQEPTEQLHCRLFVPPPLDDNVKNLAFVVHRSPEIHASPAVQHTTSSRRQRGEGAGRRFFKRLAISGPDFRVQHRIVS